MLSRWGWFQRPLEDGQHEPFDRLRTMSEQRAPVLIPLVEVVNLWPQHGTVELQTRGSTSSRHMLFVR